MFCERKAAQIAAYLLHKANGRMPHMKLLKLMYLADRYCYQHYDRSMSKDNAVSMDRGPVLSKTYNLMKGKTKSDDWSSYLSPIKDNEISLVAELGALVGVNFLKLGKLSKTDIKVLDEIYSKYEDKDQFDLSELTHDFPEWQDPHGSSIPIQLRTILKAVGKEPELIEQIVEELIERDELEMALAAQ
ncbi:MAG: Panacea domain-containing protein [Holophagaceae bacterium]|nr:Panacea domain-containing protein [Holophagaceae bacterium]